MTARLGQHASEDTDATRVDPERVAYPDLFIEVSKRGLLKPYFEWNMARGLDSRYKGYVPSEELYDHCEDAPVWVFEKYKGLDRFSHDEKGYWRERVSKRHWKKRTVDKHLEAANGILWRLEDGLIVYNTPVQIFQNLDGTAREFRSRLMPSDCVERGFDYWLFRQLEAFTGHAHALPLSRGHIEQKTGVKEKTQRRVGLYGKRNVLERPVLQGNDGDNLKIAKKLLGAWVRDGRLRIPIGSAYGGHPPVVAGDLDGKVPDSPLDYFPNAGFYFKSEVRAQEADLRYARYAVLDEGRAVPVADGPNHVVEAQVWMPGKESQDFRPINEFTMQGHAKWGNI